jgi:hypothetical protein
LPSHLEGNRPDGTLEETTSCLWLSFFAHWEEFSNSGNQEHDATLKRQPKKLGDGGVK